MEDDADPQEGEQEAPTPEQEQPGSDTTTPAASQPVEAAAAPIGEPIEVEPGTDGEKVTEVATEEVVGESAAARSRRSRGRGSVEAGEEAIVYPPLFGLWDVRDVQVTDLGIAGYINLEPILIPHVGGRYANHPFSKSKVNIVERLINNMMRTEQTTGKKAKTYMIVKHAFQMVEQKTHTNPVQVYINALINAAPREEVTRLRFGGISVPRAVDCSSSRRLDIAIRNICKGAHSKSHKNKKRLAACLADELLSAANGEEASFAVKKKDELERVAAAAR